MAILAAIHQLSGKSGRHDKPSGLGSGRLKQLNRVARRVLEQDLSAARSRHDVIPELQSCVAKAVDFGRDVLDHEFHTIPAAGSWAVTVWHRSPSRARGTAQQQPEVTPNHIGESRCRAREHFEAEVLCVEVDGLVDVLDHERTFTISPAISSLLDLRSTTPIPHYERAERLSQMRRQALALEPPVPHIQGALEVPVAGTANGAVGRPELMRTGREAAWPHRPEVPWWMTWAPRVALSWALVYGAVRVWWATGAAPSFGPLGTDLVIFGGWSAVGLCIAAAGLAVALIAARWWRTLLVAAWGVSAAFLVASALLLLDVVGGLLPGLGVAVSGVGICGSDGLARRRRPPGSGRGGLSASLAK